MFLDLILDGVVIYILRNAARTIRNNPDAMRVSEEFKLPFKIIGVSTAIYAGIRFMEMIA